MNSIFRAARLAALLAALFVVFAPPPPAAAQPMMPKTAESINSNYETLVKLIDRAEQALKDAITAGNAKQVADMRRNLDFYRRRLIALEKAATGAAKMAKDSQIVQKISALKDRVVTILGNPANKLAAPPAAVHAAAASRRVTSRPPFTPPSREQGE